MKMRLCCSVLVVCLSWLMLVPMAVALDVTAGYIESDVGLQEKGGGFYAGVQDSWPLGDGGFDFTAAGEYLQKVGSQPRYYSNEETGLTLADAKVTLHCLQPAAFLGWSLKGGDVEPRLYTGASVVLKMSESWDEPEGETEGDYGFESMDFQVHLGLTVRYSRFLIDGRYSAGLMAQLIDRTGENADPTKAAEPVVPEEGAKISSWQVGLGCSF